MEGGFFKFRVRGMFAHSFTPLNLYLTRVMHVKKNVLMVTQRALFYAEGDLYNLCTRSAVCSRFLHCNLCLSSLMHVQNMYQEGKEI